MSSAFVPADILKQMFGCLFNTEIKLSWLWWGLSLAFAACLGYCASRRGFRACGCAFLPSKRNDACRRAQEKAPETQRVVGTSWLGSLLLLCRKRRGKDVGISKARHNFCCWIFGGICRLSQEGNRWKGNSVCCLLELSMPPWDMWVSPSQAGGGQSSSWRALGSVELLIKDPDFRSSFASKCF